MEGESAVSWVKWFGDDCDEHSGSHMKVFWKRRMAEGDKRIYDHSFQFHADIFSHRRFYSHRRF